MALQSHAIVARSGAGKTDLIAGGLHEFPETGTNAMSVRCREPITLRFAMADQNDPRHQEDSTLSVVLAGVVAILAVVGILFMSGTLTMHG